MQTNAHMGSVGTQRGNQHAEYPSAVCLCAGTSVSEVRKVTGCFHTSYPKSLRGLVYNYVLMSLPPQPRPRPPHTTQMGTLTRTHGHRHSPGPVLGCGSGPSIFSLLCLAILTPKYWHLIRSPFSALSIGNKKRQLLQWASPVTQASTSQPPPLALRPSSPIQQSSSYLGSACAWAGGAWQLLRESGQSLRVHSSWELHSSGPERGKVGEGTLWLFSLGSCMCKERPMWLPMKIFQSVLLSLHSEGERGREQTAVFRVLECLHLP